MARRQEAAGMWGRAVGGGSWMAWAYQRQRIEECYYQTLMNSNEHAERPKLLSTHNNHTPDPCDYTGPKM